MLKLVKNELDYNVVLYQHWLTIDFIGYAML